MVFAILAVLAYADARAGGRVRSDEQLSADETESRKKSFWARFKDPTDGKFDVAAGEKGAAGFLPVLIPFNEPAIGVGVAGAIAYFHPSKEPPAGSREQDLPDPPSATFGGAGRAARNLDQLNDAERAHSVGTGFRYLLARKLGLGAGIDVARGPEETVVYIIFGSAWGL